MKNQLSLLGAALLLLLNACTTVPVAPPTPPTAIPPPAIATLKVTDWSALTGWADDDILPAWDAFLRSCTALINRPLWQETCTQAVSM